MHWATLVGGTNLPADAVDPRRVVFEKFGSPRRRNIVASFRGGRVDGGEGSEQISTVANQFCGSQQQTTPVVAGHALPNRQRVAGSLGG